jgi:hypothetical protein
MYYVISLITALVLLQAGATIEGVVLDSSSNQPLSGVRVTILRNEPAIVLNFQLPPPPPETMTDTQGRFSLQARETGRFRVAPTKAGFVFDRKSPGSEGAWVQLAPNVRIQGLELRMARPATISGTVREASGEPKINRVLLFQYTYGKNGQRSLSLAGHDTQKVSPRYTDDKGDFRLYDLPEGEYYLGVDYSSGGMDSGTFFYPGVLDESKATPIRVGFGEEFRVGTLTIPARPKPVELRLSVTGPADRRLRTAIEFAHSGFMEVLTSNPQVVTTTAASGRHAITVDADVVGTRSNTAEAERYYASLSVDVNNTNTVHEVILQPVPKLTGKMLLQNSAGDFLPAPDSIRCHVDGVYVQNCLSSRPRPGAHELEFQGLPADAYVFSAKAGDRDILKEGLKITGDTEIEILLARDGAVVRGTVRTNANAVAPDATVVLIPDVPYRSTSLRYRRAMTDPSGKFELHGVAPGSYKVFAWSEIPGAAYLDVEFMKAFEDRGMPLTVGKSPLEALDLTAF